jgi:ribokinase
MEVDPKQTAALIRRARAAGTRIVLNLAPAAALARDALGMLDLLVLNETEAGWLAGDLGAPPDAAGLRAALGVDTVRTLGGEGAEIATAGGVRHIPAHPVVVVVDTTAAGDCFVGVLAAALDRGAPLPDALSRASVAASLCCTRPGSQNSLPRAAETDAAMR